ncbi:hypothetical protein PR048_004784 [Dryococelus australis]|uniref:Uncharacterized protein n=1 Tax=Dryococelus australis TaxID=614101 RepID=A0ABQ9I6D1_9NEOP|nr:hypothetical protein PR048_004784 [Dryococelus australis]
MARNTGDIQDPASVSATDLWALRTVFMNRRMINNPIRTLQAIHGDRNTAWVGCSNKALEGRKLFEASNNSLPSERIKRIVPGVFIASFESGRWGGQIVGMICSPRCEWERGMGWTKATAGHFLPGCAWVCARPLDLHILLSLLLIFCANSTLGSLYYRLFRIKSANASFLHYRPQYITGHTLYVTYSVAGNGNKNKTSASWSRRLSWNIERRASMLPVRSLTITDVYCDYDAMLLTTPLKRNIITYRDRRADQDISLQTRKGIQPCDAKLSGSFETEACEIPYHCDWKARTQRRKYPFFRSCKRITYHATAPVGTRTALTTEIKNAEKPKLADKKGGKQEIKFRNRHDQAVGVTEAVSLPTSNQGDPVSIPGHSGFSHVGIAPEDAVGRRVFSGISHFPRPLISALLHTHLNHPHRLSRPRSQYVVFHRIEPTNLTAKSPLCSSKADFCAIFKLIIILSAEQLVTARDNNILYITVRFGRADRVIEVNVERRRNEGAGETGDLGENPPTNGIVRHDSHFRKSSDPAGD